MTAPCCDRSHPVMSRDLTRVVCGGCGAPRDGGDSAADNSRLRAALERYGRHEPRCGHGELPPAVCICGLNAALGIPDDGGAAALRDAIEAADAVE